MENPGDLGRRISERRVEIGLSQEELAHRARIDPNYLRHVEQDPDSALSQSILQRVANALETNIASLTGGGTQLPAGQGQPAEHGVLSELDQPTCHRLIEPGGVGRVVYCAARGPVAVPVNFKTLDQDVVFRTEASFSLIPDLVGDRISFEVDRIDDPLTEGWSVLLTGRARVITDDDEIAKVESLGVEPWALGERNTYFRLTPDVVTGRRIRGGAH